jgi:hypothetical protein
MSYLREFRISKDQDYRFLLNLLGFWWWIVLKSPNLFIRSLGNIVNLVLKHPSLYLIQFLDFFGLKKVIWFFSETLALSPWTVFCVNLMWLICSIVILQTFYHHRAAVKPIYWLKLWQIGLFLRNNELKPID